MSGDFQYKCTRRYGVRPAFPTMEGSILAGEEPFGAGSGGGPEDGGHSEFVDGTFAITANQVHLATRPPLPPAKGGPYTISLFSPGTGDNGIVEVNASQGVRITSGAPGLPPASEPNDTDGVSIEVGEFQSVYIARGLEEGLDQTISMFPEGIDIDGGAATVSLSSKTKITFMVANGVSAISLTPEGIVMKGPIIRIN